MSELIMQIQQNALKRKEFLDQLKASSNDLDAVVNFKVNSAVKKEFDRICKQNHSSVSRELKLYMLQIITQGRF